MPRSPALTASLLATAASLALLAGCAAPPHTQVHASVHVAAPAVVSVYVDPPMVQPEPVLVDVAPPPMLVDVPPPPPAPQAVWVGGYWGWQGRWVWCAGHWMTPPEAGYVWTQPYYEHRDGAVVFITGHWAAAGVAFVPPPPGLHLSLQISLDGGARPIGPAGVFVPPPPGSRAGLVVPAPLGTPPAVVVSAPPVVNVGMRVTNNIHNTSNITNNNITNVTNVTNVTVVAPPTATASGQGYQRSVPAQAHLAAALPAVVQARAPRPTAPPPPLAAPQPQPRMGALEVMPPAAHPASPPRASAPVPVPAAPPTPATPVAPPREAHPQATAAALAVQRPPAPPHLAAAADKPHPAAAHAPAARPAPAEEARRREPHEPREPHEKDNKRHHEDEAR